MQGKAGRIRRLFPHWSSPAGGANFTPGIVVDDCASPPISNSILVSRLLHWLALPALAVGLAWTPTVQAQHSVARQWNEALLDAIREDFARPTVHARNLFHTAVAMYDAWAAYDAVAAPYLLGRTVGGSACPFEGVPAPADVEAAREEAVSYAAYRLLRHRFRDSPGASVTRARLDRLFRDLGYSESFTATDYTTGSPAALGNHIAQCVITYGLQDGSNEAAGYAILGYSPVNPPLDPTAFGNPNLVDPDRWQPLQFDVFIDQSGIATAGRVPEFVGPEWGGVVPFALAEADRTAYERDGVIYSVYHDPGPPPLLASNPDAYPWGFALVAEWSSHLDPTDGVLWDISPASTGNVGPLPAGPDGYAAFYDLEHGGALGTGRAVNPRTGEPYAPQIVPRGDYTRVLAEFWADGPDSETPPGHWFTILNTVNDHPALEKRFRGTGPMLDDLAWDVRAYLVLGGAMHDAAVTAWGIKGWYDYVRPISAIRWMAGRGQRTDPTLPNYDSAGLPLIPGYIEVVEAGDPLAGAAGEHVGKIKLKAWRGSRRVSPASGIAGVGWILAETWWPYQRPTFTPPFAGYISGHSTFSRAAAEVLTLLTGDPYFPGGIGEFRTPKDSFLVFERGPSVDMTLQWATYRDASDQTSLSRIWGGIHPPADDIPGRKIGAQIGIEAFAHAERFFDGRPPAAEAPAEPAAPFVVFPNPVRAGAALVVRWERVAADAALELYTPQGRLVRRQRAGDRRFALLDTDGLASGVYLVRMISDAGTAVRTVVVFG